MTALNRTLGIILGAVVLALAPSAIAQAAPVHIDITDAVMDLGSLSGVPAIDSVEGDPPATFDGDLDGTDLTILKENFNFPTKEAEIQAGMNATINMYANEDIAGTYDPGTGELAMDVDLMATVAILGSTCTISPLQFALSTENGKPYVGQRFAGGLDQPGALSARWAGLPPVTGGGMCGTVAALIAGPGGIWMSQGIVEPQTCEDVASHPGCEAGAQPPEVAPVVTAGPGVTTEATDATFTFEAGAGETSDVTGFQCSLDGADFSACDSGTVTYTDLAVDSHVFEVKATNDNGEGPVASYNWQITEPQVCPDGTVGTPPDCQQPVVRKPRLANLKIQPKNRALKPGKRVVIKVRVKNNGNGPATNARVCVNAPKRLVRVKKCVKLGRIAAKTGKVAKFRVTVKRNRQTRRAKRAVLKFRANAKGAKVKRGKAVIRIR